MMTLSQIETELKRLNAMPAWGRKQSDDWDRLSNFVYEMPTYAELQMRLRQLNQSEAFKNYVLHRWFNTLSAMAVERIFAQCAGVLPNRNRYDKLVDFSIQGVTFDHKTTVFPARFPYHIAYAQEHPELLIRWLYDEQSKQGRFHQANRLFLVLWNADGEHWRLRAELSKIQTIIANYVAHFDARKLHEITFSNQITALSDIIWFVQPTR